jgi:hypothetical protein
LASTVFNLCQSAPVPRARPNNRARNDGLDFPTRRFRLARASAMPVLALVLPVIGHRLARLSDLQMSGGELEWHNVRVLSIPIFNAGSADGFNLRLSSDRYHPLSAAPDALLECPVSRAVRSTLLRAGTNVARILARRMRTASNRRRESRRLGRVTLRNAEDKHGSAGVRP